MTGHDAGRQGFMNSQPKKSSPTRAPARATAPSQAQPEPRVPEPTPSTARRWLLVAASLAMLAWLLFLIVLAVIG